MITVIGIGTEQGDITQRAAKAIAAAKRVFLRSRLTKAGAAAVKAYPQIQTLDDCFTAAANFDEWKNAACERLLAAQRECGSVAYLTDGAGADGCVAALRERGAELTVLSGVASARACDPQESVLTLSASDAVRIRPYLDTAVGVHITEIDDAYLAGEVKLWLMEFYSAEQEISVSVGGKRKKAALCELDRLHGYDYACEAFIAGQEDLRKPRYTFADLMRIMARLTAPDGCPWDKAQTHESIRINLIEEAYEAVDAIDGGNTDDMTEELGDVLLQAVFHCDMANRFGEFTLGDVLSELCGKLVFRHTHIFGDNKAANAAEALTFWEAAKSEEKQYVSTADKLSRLPESFPALLAAQKVYKKLIKAGVEKNTEEMHAAASGLPADERAWARRLFSLVAAMSENGYDAEVVLNTYLKNCKKEFAAAEASGEIRDFLRKR